MSEQNELSFLLEKLSNLEWTIKTQQDENNLISQKLQTLDNSINSELQRLIQETKYSISQVSKALSESEASQQKLLESMKDEVKQQHSIDNDRDSFQEPAKKQPSFESNAPLVPKVFGKLPSELLNRNLSKQELMRLSVIYEFIETEVDYVRDLNVMISLYQPQLMQSGLVSDDDLQKIFSNIAELAEVNQKFSSALLARKNEAPEVNGIGDIILASVEALKSYTVYCGSYPSAIRLLRSIQNNPSIKDRISKLSLNPESKGLSLESFLIKPVQRICKYPLLLRELIKYTDTNHLDYSALNSAFEKIESVVALVNESTNTLNASDRLNALFGKIDSLPHIPLEERKLLKEGYVIRTVNGKSKERYFVLLNDLLIVCKPVHKFKSEYETKISLIDITNQGVKISADRKVFSILVLTDKVDQWNLQFASEDEKGKWQEAFQEGLRAIPIELRRDFEKRERSISSSLTLSRTFNVHSKRNLPIAKKIISSIPVERGSQSSEVEATMIDEPDYYECGDQRWKKTLAGNGQMYYYNLKTKETTWTLHGKVIPIYSKQVFIHMDGVDLIIRPVNGLTEWRQVNKDGMKYYFNIYTMESQWNSPEPDSGSIVATEEILS